MAAIGCATCSGRLLRITQSLRILRLHRSYHKKQKGRLKDKKYRQIDLNELLGGNNAQTTSHASDGLAPLINPAKSVAKVHDASDSWKDSLERLGLLRKGEKRVAIIAVIVMILTFGAMKFMLHGMPKKELQETAGS